MIDQDLDSLEEKLKKSKKSDKKEHKVSGRSVFKLKEIIKNKAQEKRKNNQNNH